MRLTILLALLSPLLSMCQPLTLKGKVINEGGDPIPGATITLKRPPTTNDKQQTTNPDDPMLRSTPSSPVGGGQEGATTQSNNDGSFTITNLHLNDTLIITAVGYEPYTLLYDHTYTRYPETTVILRRKLGLLEEVIVNTGYQTLPKERATGSFELITNEKLNLQTGSNILNRLRGTSTLLFDDNPLRPPLTLRGPSSILGNKDPLIIVDNFPYAGSIQNINPADVENITILKDAAAASIWGARAGNGVIVITTKKGTTGQPLRVEWNATTEITGRPLLSQWQTVGAADFIEAETFLFSKGFRFSDTLNLQRPAFSPVYEILFRQQSGRLTAGEAEAQINELRKQDIRTDLLDHLYKPAVQYQQTLGIRGGSAVHTYYFSAGWNNRTDNLGGRTDRITLHSENTFRLRRNLRLSAALSYARSDYRSGRPSLDQLKTYLYPYTRLADDNGTPLAITRSLRQPYADTAGGGRLLNWDYVPLEDGRHNTSHTGSANIQATFGLHYKVWEAWSLDLTYQYQQEQSATTNLQNEESYVTRDLVNRFTQVNWANGTIRHIIPKGSILDRSLGTTTANNLRAQLGYNKTAGDLGLSVLAGAEIRDWGYAGNAWRLYGYNSTVLTTMPVDYITAYPDYRTGALSFVPFNNTAAETDDHFVSLYTNGALTWKARYTVSGSARRDASNIFGASANNRWRPLWSAGSSWLISGEPFYRFTVLPHLRLRLTYGYSGNIDQQRSALTVIGYNANAAGTNFPSANIRQFPNPSLRWEKLGTLNLGVDFAVKNNRLSGSIDYYRKRGTDLFGNAPVDYTAVGTTFLTVNVANMKGAGIDFNLASNNISGPLEWSTALLFSYNNTVVTKYFPLSTRGFDHVSNGTKITAITGYPVYAVLSFPWAGLDTLGNPVGLVNKSPTTNYAAILGTATQLTDLVYSGPATPRFYGSLSNSIAYRRFTLTAALLCKFGYWFRKESVSYDQLFNQRQAHADFSQRWRAPGDENRTTVPSMIYPNNASRDAFYSASEVLARRGDNIRLQFINLSYTGQTKKEKPGFIQQWRLYLAASDLGIIWRANKDGLDPDYGTALPPAKTVALGFSVTFR